MQDGITSQTTEPTLTGYLFHFILLSYTLFSGELPSALSHGPHAPNLWEAETFFSFSQ